MVQGSRRAAGIVVLAALAIPARAAAATTLEVNTAADLAAPGCTGGPCSIRQALAAAAPGDTIHVPANAAHYAVSAGELSVTKDVTIAGDSQAGTVIDAGGTSRILNVAPPAALRLRQATLTGGASDRGAAIEAIAPGALTLDHVTASGNTAGGAVVGFGIVEVRRGHGLSTVNIGSSTFSGNTLGGAAPGVGTVDLEGDVMTVTVDASMFTGNTLGAGTTAAGGSSAGGGIEFNPDSAGSSLTVTNSTFSGNLVGTDGTASSSGPGVGGGIAIFGRAPTVTVTGSTFANNKVGGGDADGGGIAFFGFGNNGRLDVSRSTFTGNVVGTGVGGAALGGGIRFAANSGSGSTLSVTDSSFTQNTLGGPAPRAFAQGGGLDIQPFTTNPTITLARDLIAGNHVTGGTAAAASGGGGIYMHPVNGPVGGIVNTTITGNSADGNGGGIAAATEYTTALTNVTLAGNSATTSGGNVWLLQGTPLSLVNTILTAGAAPSHPDCDGAVTSLGHNLEQGTDCQLTAAGDLNADPLLGPLQANGGPTATLALPTGSPAIGAADPAACPPTDQRGIARASRCDIGAFEVAHPAPPPPPPPPPPSPPAPPTPPPLACVAGKLTLTDVFPRGSRTQLIGVAPGGTAGQTVTLVSTWNHKRVATATVQPDLSFTASAPLPPRSLRLTDRARYQAKLGGKTSQALKLVRRMYTTGLSVKGARVTFAGRIVPPLAKPLAPVVIRASAECSTIGSGRIVARAKPSRRGTFTATFTLAPSLAGHAIVFLRAGTKVRTTAASRRSSSTFTLIRGVRTG